MGKTDSTLGKVVKYGEKQSANSFPYLSFVPPKADVPSFTPGFSTSGLCVQHRATLPLPRGTPLPNARQTWFSQCFSSAVKGLR